MRTCSFLPNYGRFYTFLEVRKVLPELAIYADVEGHKEQEGYQPVDYQVHVDDVDLRTIRYVERSRRLI
jgi:hypothetical protein